MTRNYTTLFSRQQREQMATFQTVLGQRDALLRVLGGLLSMLEREGYAKQGIVAIDHARAVLRRIEEGA